MLESSQYPAQWTTDGSFVFADISGFTKLSEQLAELGKAGAEELTVLLNGTFEALLGVARSEGGDLVKFGGDALFLFFHGPGHAARACRAAHGMRAALKARGPVVTGRGRVVLRISMGVHSGPFLFVLAGERQRELFVLGEHATTVTEMESAADAGEILISPATAELLPAPWLGALKGGGVLLRRVGETRAEADASSSVDGSASDAEAEVDIEPLVPAAIRRRLDDDQHGAEHRRATIAFVHVGGVDALLHDEGSEAVAARLHAIVTRTVEVAAQHEVSLLATDVAGGGIKLILTAGVPDAVEDSEGRMLAVGRALLDAQLGLPIRVGVNSGHVFAGEVGATWRRVYTVMGDAVNLSARLMAKAAHGELVASKVTLDQSATNFEATALEPFMVKGKRHPQLASSVGRRIEGRGRGEMAHVPLVGRQAELEELVAGVQRALAGTGEVVQFVGEAGLGKSRLVQELTAVADDTRVVRVTCEPFAVDRPYFMARILLRSGMGIPFDADPADAGVLLQEWLVHHADEWVPLAPLLAVAVDADVPSTRMVDDLGAEFRAGRLREAGAAVLRRAFDVPIVLVVEDAMWMDEASALLIAQALREVEQTRWFVCLTTRDITQGLSGRSGFEATTIELEPLGDDLAERLAAELTDSVDVSHSELLELCGRARGNPLFLLELAHARLELGSFDDMPGSLEDLIGARIDRLAPGDRTLLRHAAVLGDRFAPRLFERTLGSEFSGPIDWERLGDFVVRDQGELRFAHDLVRRVAYGGLPFRLRRELHRRIAEALVPRGEPDDARVGLLALHFDGSGDHPLAWKFNRLAAERARHNYAMVESAALFERAVQHARADAAGVAAAELAEVYEAMADVALLAGRHELCRDGLRGARRLRKDDPLVFARLCRKEGKLRERLGHHAAAAPWYRLGLTTLDSSTVADTTEAIAERAQIEVERGALLIVRQRYRAGARWCHRAIEHALAAGERRAEAHAYYLLEWAASETGDEHALQYLELAQPIYEDLGDYLGLGVVLLNRGVAALGAGKWREAESHYHASRAGYQRGGDIVGMAHAAHNLAELLVDLGRVDEAEPYMREARRIWRSSGFAMGVAAVTGALGRAVGRLGRIDEGVELLLDARDRFAALEHAPFTAETTARLAEIYLFAGRPDDAIEVLDQLGDDTAAGGPSLQAYAWRLRAVALARTGRVDEADALLQRASAVASEGGVRWEAALADLERTRLSTVEPHAARELDAAARAVLDELGVDADRVLIPAG
ncbi:MAG: tetratricopeptide repeat protein [Actinobacteria bacterium]|nr:tetratricopeptide repeat protein [Actinomycetota bacterium]